jgi:hypothetical protein
MFCAAKPNPAFFPIKRLPVFSAKKCELGRQKMKLKNNK